MKTMVSRRAIAAVLPVLFAVPVGAESLGSPGFDACRVQKDCRRLSPAELDRLRGGFSFMSSIGPIEITFGLTQAVYINNQLVAVTQLMGNVGGSGQSVGTVAPRPSQAQALNAAAQGAPVTPLSSSVAAGASASAAAASNAVQSAASAASGAPVVSASPTSTPPTQTTGLNTTLNAAGSQAPVSSSKAASAAPVAPSVSATGSAPAPGSPVISVPSAGNLRVLIVQNGAGNVVVPNAADIAAGVGAMVQNTLNDQSIRAVTQMNVSMALSKAMSAASIRDAVRQGMATSRP